MQQTWLDVRVVNKWQEAEDIFGFELASLDGADLPPFSAGAHIDVEVRAGLVRQYSLCNNPERRNVYQIGVLREPGSRGGSVGMVDDVRAGQTVRISEPRNHFPLEPSSEHTLLVAGGIGVTPILCMAERLSHIGAPFEMHYGARTPSRAAFRSRIAASAFADKVHFHFDDGPSDQRLDLDSLLADRGAGVHLYVCGPAGLIEAVLSKARSHNWPEGRLHREYFAAAPTAAGPSDGFEIELASSGQVLSVPEGTSIVEALAQHGVEVPVSCEQGVCGTCLTRVLSGVPDHRDFFLTPEEQAKGDQMTICCSRAKSSRLVLDL